MTPDLYQLLDTLDPHADRVTRNLWLARLLQWIRGQARDARAAAGRVELLLDALQARPECRARVQALWVQTFTTVDASIVLSDFGLPSRAAFVGELVDRIQLKLLPASPDTADGGELFGQLLHTPFDGQWLDALGAPTVERLAALLHIPATPSAAALDSHWKQALAQAITFCTSQIRAIGFSVEVRARLPDSVREANPFLQLAADWDHALAQWQATGPAPDGLVHYQARLEACRTAARTVYDHLDRNGISVDLVFRLRQLRERIARIQQLLYTLLESDTHRATVALLQSLCDQGLAQRSVRALVAENSSLLAAKVAERSSETGEHYITRNWAEYRQMLRQSAGGGAVMSLTTVLKFGIMALGFSAFWYGFWAGVLYAVSFVLIQILHFTVATKQPAMTAPAMAAKLRDLHPAQGLADFADEVEHLVRSQVASVLGNLALVVPCALALCWGWSVLVPQPVISADTARYVLHALDLRGPTLLFAAFTGVLLFSSSILAGWAENWFVLHKLDSAIRFNPRITDMLGQARAARWAQFLRANISGIAANTSLGFMLGLVPAVLQFLGIGLDARHVTLSAGQLAVALASLGPQVLHAAEFWWAAAALPFIGALNVLVSFVLAFRVALRAQNVTVQNRRLLYRTLGTRLRQQPLRFFLPPSNPQATHA
ncbi:MAG: site-specific recombinase [Rhodoferax sp.]